MNERVVALAHAAERAAQQKGFLAWDLARLRSPTTVARMARTEWSPAIGLQLGLDSADLTRLELCRSPRRDRGFRSDVQAIADYVGVDPRRLAATVRLADSQGLCPVLQHDARPDNLGRAGVSWTRLAFSTARSGE